ncbi:MAG TPA: tRNA (adenosine(37)-N6)-threonylcarbamoyltransferase complex dimerization subunit type 1 TsaB, partial [Candidatus Acidoferrales bacterium]|nr:tRNA (adenosine(37)-N6)-threonylcarbamoyltransferase complex dimerization subunit type 1 TsaB [Candidatus Acidoferrales bacterium]
MLILALDTSSPAGSLALLRDDAVIATAPAWSGELYSSRMFRQLELLLREHTLSFNNIDVFAVVVGPGSFTGLRVGLAAVKGWAEVYRKPIAPVSALEAVAAQSSLDVPVLVPVLDARRAQIYFAIYEPEPNSNGRDLKLAGRECVSTPEEFFSALDSRFAVSELAIVTPVPELLASAMSRYETTRSISGHLR